MCLLALLGWFLVLGGDFNCTAIPQVDKNNWELHTAHTSMLKLVQAHELCDMERYFHPGQRQFTWTQSTGNQLSLASLDWFCFFKHCVNIVSNVWINQVGFFYNAIVVFCIVVFKNICKCILAF